MRFGRGPNPPFCQSLWRIYVALASKRQTTDSRLRQDHPIRCVHVYVSISTAAAEANMMARWAVLLLVGLLAVSVHGVHGAVHEAEVPTL